MMIDTQILIYWFNRQKIINRAHVISSVVANEFLEAYDKIDLTKNHYYIPYYKGKARGRWSSRRDRTDKIIMNFSGEFPTVVEHGSLAIASSLNEKRRKRFWNSIKTLPKERRERIWKKYRFLETNVAKCMPLSEHAVELALDMLDDFTTSYNMKLDFRNSLNDFLILATAVVNGEKLRTQDSLLVRFAADRFAKGVTVQAEKTVMIDFGSDKEINNPTSCESKGYINRGWQIAVQKANATR